MRAPLRRLAASAARPLGAALDRRFDELERRLLERFDRLEERVAVDAETTAELTSGHRRSLERIEARLAALEAALDAAPRTPARRGRPARPDAAADTSA